MNNTNNHGNAYLKKITIWETEISQIEVNLANLPSPNLFNFLAFSVFKPNNQFSDWLTKLEKITSGCLKILDTLEYDKDLEYPELQNKVFELRIKANLLAEKIAAKNPENYWQGVLEE